MFDFKKAVENMTPEDIKMILRHYNVEPVSEDSNKIIYPTVCHNVSGGSPKLYYYKDIHLFKCYTECGEYFSIFSLLKKIHTIRGIKNSILTYVNKDADYYDNNKSKESYELEYLTYLLSERAETPKTEILDSSIIDAFQFNEKVLKIWQKEGISFDSMRKYNIRYDITRNCIIIPVYDDIGQLVSVRGRFLDEDIKAKYKPIVFNGQLLNCPSSCVLYGLDKNKEAIKKYRKAIIFEGEKSVMKMDTIYGENNLAVATLGQNISHNHIDTLRSLDVNEIILAYDADYKTPQELDAKRQDYIHIVKKALPYFRVSILMDNFKELQYKDSPIDRGQQIFERIMKDRYIVWNID